MRNGLCRRGLSLYTNRFVSLRATRSFFFREALAQSGVKRHGGRTPVCRVEWNDAKWPVPARVKILYRKLSVGTLMFHQHGFPLADKRLITTAYDIADGAH